MDAPSIRIRKPWCDLDRAVGRPGQTIALLLTERRDERAALRVLTRALRRHGVPVRITIAASQANAAAIASYNAEHSPASVIRPGRYLNQGPAQDHRAVKGVVCPRLGLKSCATAQRPLAGIELMHMLRKGQLESGQKPGQPPAEPFDSLAA